MMRRLALPVALVPAMLAGCASAPETAGTLAELRSRSPDVQEVAVDQGLERAMEGYRRFLEETPETPMTPEAMSLDVSDDRKTIYVHAMYVDDLEASKKEIKEALEKRILELSK